MDGELVGDFEEDPVGVVLGDEDGAKLLVGA